GAPFVDPVALKNYLEALNIPGTAWRLAAFRPTFQKQAGQVCRGLQLHVTDRNALDSTATSYAILAGLLATARDGFAWRHEVYEFVADRLAIDLLLGDDKLRLALEAGENPLTLARNNQDT